MVDELNTGLTPDGEENLGTPVPGGAGAAPSANPASPSIPADQLSSPSSLDDEVERQMLEELARAEAQDATMAQPATVQPVEFDRFARNEGVGQPRNIDILLDVKLPVSIELGRTEMTIRDILELGSGSVVELTKLAGEPVDLLVNNRIVARGEVVVVDENFGLRVTSLISPEERLKSL
jgi:flagellar motor switch protein FliN/FliY